MHFTKTFSMRRLDVNINFGLERAIRFAGNISIAWGTQKCQKLGNALNLLICNKLRS